MDSKCDTMITAIWGIELKNEEVTREDVEVVGP
jgi:hypothetical protein